MCACKNKRDKHSNGFYQYHAAPFSHPGSMNQVFQAQFALPPVSPWGNSQPVFGSLNVVQPPQVYRSMMLGIQGIGGVQAGSMILQGLLDPTKRTDNGE